MYKVSTSYIVSFSTVAQAFLHNKGGLSATITAANHSNAEVKVSVTYTPSGTQVDGVSAFLTGNEETLDSAVIAPYYNSYESADSCEFVLSVTGTPTSAASEVVIGTITVTISAP